MAGEAPAAAPAPSNGNGAKAPTAPAPGVTTSTPTPKNGEGAVVAPPKPESKWQALKTKLKFGDGSEEEVEVPDEETLQRRLIAAKGFDRASKEKKAALEELEHVKRLAQESPEEFLRAFKHDPKALAKSWAEQELKRLEMTAEQRQADDARREVSRLKAEAAATKKQLEEYLQKQQMQQQWESEKPQWAEALTKRSRMGDEGYIELASRVRQHLEANGINATVEQICALTDEEDKRLASRHVDSTPVSRLMEGIAKRVTAEELPLILKALAPKLTPQLLWDVLGDDLQRRNIMSIGLAWHKGLRGTQSTTPPPARPKPPEERRIRSESEWRAERDGLLK